MMEGQVDRWDDEPEMSRRCVISTMEWTRKQPHPDWEWTHGGKTGRTQKGGVGDGKHQKS